MVRKKKITLNHRIEDPQFFQSNTVLTSNVVNKIYPILYQFFNQICHSRVRFGLLVFENVVWVNIPIG